MEDYELYEADEERALTSGKRSSKRAKKCTEPPDKEKSSKVELLQKQFEAVGERSIPDADVGMVTFAMGRAAATLAATGTDMTRHEWTKLYDAAKQVPRIPKPVKSLKQLTS